MPLPLAAAPRGPVEVPPAVRALAAGAVVDPVWRNQLGGLTFRLTGTSGTRYVKWVATGTPALDLGTLGVADRWADLATASTSLGWNYGEGHQAAFFAAYGIDPDAERILFYRRLWNLG